MTAPAFTHVDSNTYTIRLFREEDYPAVAELMVRHDLETVGSSNSSEELLRSDWDMPRFDPLNEVALAVDANDYPVGLMVSYKIRPVPVRPVMWGYALPEHRAEVTAPLIAWGVAQAKSVLSRVPQEARVVAEANTHFELSDWAAELKNAGFSCQHVLYTMLIKFDAPLPSPILPDGMRVVTFAELPDVPTWARTLRSSFVDHRGTSADITVSYDIERYEKEVGKPDFDPEIWWLVMDGEVPAAICTGFNDSDEFPNTAYILQLGTVPQYRKRGIGLALLHHAFNEHRRRGRDGVSLGVDGSSLTNAVALYERAGMHIAAQWDRYEMELRPGIEMTVQ